jgi:hypothetical protein
VSIILLRSTYQLPPWSCYSSRRRLELGQCAGVRQNHCSLLLAWINKLVLAPLNMPETQRTPAHTHHICSRGKAARASWTSNGPRRLEDKPSQLVSPQRPDCGRVVSATSHLRSVECIPFCLLYLSNSFQQRSKMTKSIVFLRAVRRRSACERSFMGSDILEWSSQHLLWLSYQHLSWQIHVENRCFSYQ